MQAAQKANFEGSFAKRESRLLSGIRDAVRRGLLLRVQLKHSRIYGDDVT
jgi:hypothetical protein